eukprot:COSAG02_NODE_25254_length_664_cov_1.033628_2_plen_82_part_01
MLRLGADPEALTFSASRKRRIINHTATCDTYALHESDMIVVYQYTGSIPRRACVRAWHPCGAALLMLARARPGPAPRARGGE